MNKDSRRVIGFNILGQWVKVKYQKVLADPADAGGFSHNRKGPIIEIATDQSDIEIFKTLIHEYGHGLIKMSCHDEQLSDEVEEVFCRLIENLAEIVYFRPNSPKLRYSKLVVD